MSSIYLYVKTHNITGLKYLGKTMKDPFKYKGSGKHWLRHIKKHGNEVFTEIIFQTENEEELKEKGLYYSQLWNIVESDEWANLVTEMGQGNDTSKHINYVDLVKKRKKNNKKWLQTEESNIKRSIAHKEYWKSEKSLHRHRKEQKEFIGPPRPPGWYLNNKRKHMCPHCNNVGDLRNMKRWHFDNCKLVPK